MTTMWMPTDMVNSRALTLNNFRVRFTDLIEQSLTRNFSSSEFVGYCRKIMCLAYYVSFDYFLQLFQPTVAAANAFACLMANVATSIQAAVVTYDCIILKGWHFTELHVFEHLHGIIM